MRGSVRQIWCSPTPCEDYGPISGICVAGEAHLEEVEVLAADIRYIGGQHRRELQQGILAC